MLNKRYPYLINRFILLLSFLYVIFALCFSVQAKPTTKSEQNHTASLSQKLADDVPFLIDELIETSTNIGELRSIAIAEPLNLTQQSINLETLKQAIQAQLTDQTIYALQSPKVTLTSLPIQIEDEEKLKETTLKNYVKQVKPLKIDFILFTNIIENKQDQKQPVLLVALFDVKKASIKWRFYSSEQI